jgi:hypothetical protein
MTLKQHRLIQWIAIALILTLAAGWYYRAKVEGNQTIESSRSDFEAPLTNSLDLKAGVGTPSFARADGADRRATITDFEGRIIPVKQNEARFEGARRVENLLSYSEDFSNAAWAKSGGVVTPNTAVAPDGTLTADTLAINVASLGVYKQIMTKPGAYRWSVWVNGVAGTVVNVGANTDSGGAEYKAVTLSGNWQRVSGIATLGGTAIANVYFHFRTDYPGSYSAYTCYAWGAQVEDVTGQSNQNPSEYVSTGVKTQAPYHGANVDGVKYFTTQNGNTVSGNVVTEATGAAIPASTLRGYLAEGSRTNLVGSSTNFQANWNNNGLTITDNNMVAPDGTLTAGTTATQGGTRYAVITGVSTSTYVYSVYVKPITPTATQRLYVDGSGGWGQVLIVPSTGVVSEILGIATSAASQNVGNGWYRISMNLMTTNSGYLAVYIYPVRSELTGWWGAQFETASFASSYIPTTSASVTRAGDVLSYPSSGNTGEEAFSLSFEMNRKNNSSTSVPKKAPIQIGTYNTASTVNFGGYSGQNVTLLNRFGAPVWDLAPSPFSLTYGTPTKLALRMASDLATFTAFKDGTKSPNYVSGNAKSAAWSGSNIYIANSGASDVDQNMTIKNIKLWKKALTDTQLQNLTSTDDDVANSAVKTTTINVNQNNKLTNGLVGLWSFNGKDMSGNSAIDRSGSGNNGTLTNGPTRTIGKVGQGLNFDGVDDSVGISSGLALSGSPFTLSAWVKDTGDLTNDIVFDATAGRVAMEVNLGNLGCLTNNDSWKSGGTVLVNTWTHLVCVFDGTNMKGYIDGANVFSVADNAPAANPTSMSVSGNTGHQFLFPGAIDEVRVYNRALSAKEVSDLYNLGK